MFAAAREQAEQRSAETWRRAEPLALADDDVRAPGAGGFQDGERQRVGGYRERDLAQDSLELGQPLVEPAEPVRKIDQGAEDVPRLDRGPDPAKVEAARPRVERDLFQ